MASALMRYFCNDTACLVDKSMRERQFDDIHHVFMAGGFTDNDVARKMIIREIVSKVLAKTVLGIVSVTTNLSPVLLSVPI